MVQHFHLLQTEFGVFVFQRIKRMRASGDDFAHPVPLERRDVLLAQLLEQELVAHPARRIAGVALLIAKDGEIDARFV
ncbi:hypothetical protein D3C76_1499200 [compost metagenome]